MSFIPTLQNIYNLLTLYNQNLYNNSKSFKIKLLKYLNSQYFEVIGILSFDYNFSILRFFFYFFIKLFTIRNKKIMFKLFYLLNIWQIF